MKKGGVRCMSLYCAVGSPDTDLSAAQLKELLYESLAKLGPRNERAGRAARSEPRALARRRAHALHMGALRRQAQSRAARHRHAYAHAARPDHAHVRQRAAGTLPRPQLAHRYRHARRSAGRVHPRAVRGQAGLPVARAGEQARLAGRLRSDSLHRPGGAA